MKLDLFNKGDKVLLVGEGNLSFTADLITLLPFLNITSTCAEKDVSLKLQQENISILESKGVRVILGVDGTNLINHPILKFEKETFTKIIFNFPHVGGKMKIHLNRQLLRNFCVSSSNMLSPDGNIIITLCKGQGGTMADLPQRRWDDSWQVVEMAAHGHLVLTDAQFIKSIMLRSAYILTWCMKRTVFQHNKRHASNQTAVALRNKKKKSTLIHTVQRFVDSCNIRTIGGNGGDGAISFMQLWCNEHAGPDGGDGGSGGHIIFEACSSVNNLSHIPSVIKASDGEKGGSKDCFGKNADHTILKVPIGTVIKSEDDEIADLGSRGMLFIAARGGAGGHGNHFFASDINQTPEVAEFGAVGEDLNYHIEVKSIAHIGLLGFPNAGKSTLLRAISRARPKVAPYPFTTLQPHIGIVKYDDYEQIAVADLPGLIPDSHKNRGLGIQFLKHVDRCSTLLIIVDTSSGDCSEQIATLRNELRHYSVDLAAKPQIIVANKMDLPEAKQNLKLLKEHFKESVIPISAKTGENISELLTSLRQVYDTIKQDDDDYKD